MMHKKMILIGLLLTTLLVSSVFGAYLTYKGFVEIYGTKYPLGIVELDIGKLKPIEGLEAREDYLGKIRVWTYSDNAEVVLQLVQLSQIVTNFRSFTVKVCLPLDVVLVVDVTGSMGPYMAPIKAELKDLMWVLATMDKCPVQFAVVGFKDLVGDTIVNPSGLTNDYDEVATFIEGLTAASGGPIPQSHYLGLLEAERLFDDEPNSLVHDKIVVFISDAESGYNDLPEFSYAMHAAWGLANKGVKIHSVLCGPDEEPEGSQLRYYSAISGGNFIHAPLPDCRLVPGVTSNPTWIVKLTPITPFDSFRMKLNSSTPTMKQGYYEFGIWVDFFCKAVPWHEFFVTELTAHLEKAELPPYTPPPPIEGPPPPPIGVALTINPIEQDVGENIIFSWVITSPPEVTPVHVELTLDPPVGAVIPFDEDLHLTGSRTWVAILPDGEWTITVTYTYQYMGTTYYAGAMGTFRVVD